MKYKKDFLLLATGVLLVPVQFLLIIMIFSAWNTLGSSSGSWGIYEANQIIRWLVPIFVCASGILLFVSVRVYSKKRSRISLINLMLYVLLVIFFCIEAVRILS